VTGGSGFVGRPLIRALRARDIEVIALARSDAAAATVVALGATAARGDLGDMAALRAGCEGCDVVFHSAAHLDHYDPLEVHLRVTVQGTENTLAAARSAGVKRFVHVSTEAVLGDGKPIVNADETRPLPASPYGVYPISKGRAETAVVRANGASLETVVVRPRFIWGKGDTTLLPQLVEAVQAGKYVWIDGGRYLSSFVHVDNCVEGMLLAAERGTPGAIYFLTDGPPIEFRTFITKLLATQGVTAPSRSIPHWLARALVTLTSVLPRPPLTKSAFSVIAHEVTVDDRKARRELGYTAHTSVEQGLAELANASAGA
jgi:nucleoside-diphosphate-sugar epimerase